MIVMESLNKFLSTIFVTWVDESRRIKVIDFYSQRGIINISSHNKQLHGSSRFKVK